MNGFIYLTFVGEGVIQLIALSKCLAVGALCFCKTVLI